MKPASPDFERPSLPSAYVVLWLALMERRGISAAQVLANTGLALGKLDAEDERVTPLAFALMVANSMRLTSDPTLGYAFGLEMKPTTHGFLGYALVTCSTLRDAIRLGERYIRLRVDVARLCLTIEGETAVLVLEDQLANGLVRQFALEVITAAIVRAGELLLGEQKPPVEIWVDYAEPPYYARLSAQLPKVRFDMPRTELRFPSSYLERPLALADPVASRAAIAQLERELALVGGPEDDVVARVRAGLADPQEPFAELASVAKRLGMSERTLKRKLKLHGTSYQRLLDEARRERATALLRDPSVQVEHVASALGYTDPANFTRAFRKWTGQTPSEYRRLARMQP